MLVFGSQKKPLSLVEAADAAGAIAMAHRWWGVGVFHNEPVATMLAKKLKAIVIQAWVVEGGIRKLSYLFAKQPGVYCQAPDTRGKTAQVEAEEVVSPPPSGPVYL